MPATLIGRLAALLHRRPASRRPGTDDRKPESADATGTTRPAQCGNGPASAAGALAPSPVIPGNQDILEHPLVVFDLETSGLDVGRDAVLSLGAVRIEGGAIPLAGHLDRVLRVDARLKPDSQLMHGLSQDDLRRGADPAAALAELLAYGGGRIWLAFHAEFDRRMLDRALRQHLGSGFGHPLFDVAALAPMLFPEHDRRDAGLDHWAGIFGLATPARHTAAGDAQLTAEIALVLLHEARRQGLRTWGGLAGALRQWERRRAARGGPMF